MGCIEEDWKNLYVLQRNDQENNGEELGFRSDIGSIEQTQ
jgi:hypothetical protein